MNTDKHCYLVMPASGAGFDCVWFERRVGDVGGIYREK